MNDGRRTVRKALKAERLRIDDGPIAGNEVSRKATGRRSDSEAVAREAAREKKPRQGSDRPDHGNHVRCDVDKPCPPPDDFSPGEGGECCCELRLRLVE